MNDRATSAGTANLVEVAGQSIADVHHGVNGGQSMDFEGLGYAGQKIEVFA